MMTEAYAPVRRVSAGAGLGTGGPAMMTEAYAPVRLDDQPEPTQAVALLL